MRRDWASMKAPVILVTATLTAAILLAGWLLIITTRSEAVPAGKLSQAAPKVSIVARIELREIREQQRRQ